MLLKELPLTSAQPTLVTSSVRVLFNEPTVVAVSTDDKVVAVGNAAKEMLGRTPVGTASRPYVTVLLLTMCDPGDAYYLQSCIGSTRILKPDVMVSVPVGVTSVESRAVLDAAFSRSA